MEDLNTQTIRGYQLRERIGEGGFGAVYRAYQPVVEREVAIKVILREFANQAHFIRRFDFEAQLIAQLEHPYIVPLYDYWREPGGAYLVMRLFRTNLRAELAEGRWSPEATSRLLDQIALALTGDHRHGVVHRDIKPDNILLDDENNAYLADFGIAISPNTPASDAGRDEGEIGSIGYVTPEQIRGDPLSSQTDLYSLGIVIYEMLAGHRPYTDDLTVTELIDRQLHVPLPPLDIGDLQLPSAVNTVLQRATSKDPALRFPDALSMAHAFRQALNERLNERPSEATAVTPVTIPELIEPENPYKGLRAFQQSDASDFYGREALVNRLLERLRDDHFLAVIGPSGSGKSSVVSAGLLPALQRGRLPGSEHWYAVELLAGAHPIRNFENALLSIAIEPTALSQLLEAGEGSLVDAIRAVLPTDETIKVLLVIDQFEEVFTLVDDEAERVRFLNGLHEAVTDLEGRLRVVITLRADFMDRPLQFPKLGELIRRNNEFVLPLSPEELRQAIVRPAEHAGVGFEPKLVTAILNDVENQPGALPLLEYALTELFERRQGQTLTLDMYHTNGGLLGSLARHAQELYSQLSAEQQALARQMFLRLVTPGDGTEDTRRRVNQEELISLTGDRRLLNAVLESFGKHRLLTFDRDAATRLPTIEIAHEALIRTWPRLREWIDASREELRIQRRLMTAVQEWVNAGRETSFLASGARLDQFEAWVHNSSLTLNQTEAQYLQASIAERDARLASDKARVAREEATARQAANFQRATIGLSIAGLLAVVSILILAVQTANAIAEVNRSNALVATAQTQVAYIARTLTPIPITLTAVDRQLESSQRTMEVLRLAAEANKLLLANDGNVETAALLSIRALRTAYLPQADTALRQALEHDYTQQIFGGYSDAVYGVAFSPEGRFVLIGGANGVAQLRDAQSGQVVRTFTGHGAAINSVAFSPDGKTILTGSKDTTARLWDVQTGHILRIFGTQISPVYRPGHTSSVNSVAFSPDGRFVVTSSRDRTARLWNVQTGDLVRTFRNNGAVWSVTFSPDGKYILAGVRDNIALLWDIESGAIVRTFVGHTGTVWSVAYSRDGKYVLTGSGDNTARLWDANTGESLHVLSGHNGVVNSVAFSPDNKHVITGSDDATARVWDAETGQTFRILSGHNGSIWSVAFSWNGQSALTGGDDHVARKWDARSDQQPFVFANHSSAVWKALFSADNRSIVTASDDGSAQLWDVQSRRKIRIFSAPKGAVYSIAFSPDDKYLGTAGSDNIARLWDVQSGELIREFRVFTANNSLYSIVFSPDGKYLFTAGNDANARLWDVQTGQVVQTFTGHKDSISSAAYSPDGKFVLTGSNDHKAQLWDAKTGQALRTFEHPDIVSSVAFSPDGKFILTGCNDTIARLWNAATGELIHTLIGHTNAVSGVAFSPDGKLIATGSYDTTVRTWEANTGQSLRLFAGHTNSVSSVAFSPDGKFVLASSVDKTVRLWEADYHDFIAYACAQLPRDFTDDERLRFALTDKQATCPEATR